MLGEIRQVSDSVFLVINCQFQMKLSVRLEDKTAKLQRGESQPS